MAKLQGMSISYQPTKHEGLLQKIKETTVVDTVHCIDFGSVRMLPAEKRDKKLEQYIVSKIEAEYPERVKEVDLYEHSSNVHDIGRIAPAFNKLCSKEFKPFNREVVRVILIQRLIEMRLKNKQRRQVDLSAKALSSIEYPHGSASGILPLRPIPGLALMLRGKKADMMAAAVTVASSYDHLRRSRPMCIPCLPFLKGEVIKKDKNVRGIQNESLVNYLILKAAGLSNEVDFSRGNAIGLGGRDGSFTAFFDVWFCVYHQQTGENYEQFLDFIEFQGAHESDKVGWEASTSVNDGLPLLYEDLMSVSVAGSDKRRLAAALADCYNPFIYIDKSGFFAPWRIASGTLRTSDGNTRRHGFMNDWMVWFIESHGNSLCRIGCRCFVCDEFNVEHHVKPILVKLRRYAVKLGDDYLAVSFGLEGDSLFDRIMDFVFGTETKTFSRKFFNEPHAEFLRRSFKRDGDKIYWYRDEGRVLAKLRYGSFLKDRSRTCAAIVSFMFECGANERLFEFLHGILRHLLPDMDYSVFSEEIRLRQRKNHMLSDFDPYLEFFYSDFENIQHRTQSDWANVLVSLQYLVI